MATANDRLRALASYLDLKGVKYDIRDQTALSCNFKGDNIQHLPIVVRFDDSGNTAHFVGVRVASVPDNRLAAVMLACNRMNMQYRWIKVYIDDDHDIMADCDAVIDDATASEECLEIIYRMIDIVDSMYPEFMKALYS